MDMYRSLTKYLYIERFQVRRSLAKLSKVVIPAAGVGTRLLPATKEQPKEMLPVFSKSTTGNVTVKPILQVIFEQLYGFGFREFYFVVGRSKRAIEDHFTADYDFVDFLGKQGKSHYAKELHIFYEKLSLSRIVWINQHSPQGFGHAVLMAGHLIGRDEDFLVHAGDTLITSKKNQHLKDLIKAHSSTGAAASLLVRRVKDPRQFGVAIGKRDRSGIIRIDNLEEKPQQPKSNLALMPVYVFNHSLLDCLEKTPRGKGNEIQLTDGIVQVMRSGGRAIALQLKKDDVWIDVGNPDSYWLALSESYHNPP